MGKFLAELKRRNVFKVATIYVVISWLLLRRKTNKSGCKAVLGFGICFSVFSIDILKSFMSKT